jgi:hypothetical protein
MATAVIAGLLVATLLTLVLVPVLYAFFDDFEIWLRDLFASKERPSATRPGRPTATSPGAQP